jgi:ligand-binding sensor domain-containing protein
MFYRHLQTMRFFLAFYLLVASKDGYPQLLTAFLQGSDVNAIARVDSFIYVATSSGLWQFDNRDFRPISISASGTGELTDVTVDDDQQLWVGTQSNWLYINQGARWRHVIGDSGAPARWISDLYKDGSSRIWIGTDSDTAGVGIYDGIKWHRITTKDYWIYENNKWRRVAIWLPGTRGLRDNRIKAIHQDVNGCIWIGSSTGATRFRGALDSAGVVSRSNWSYCPSLTGSTVLAFENDSNGKLWAGTETNGVFRLVPNCNSLCTVDSSFNKTKFPTLRIGTVHDITRDRDGNLWFGTSNGALRYNPFIGSWRHFSQADHASLQSVNTVFEDSDANLWIGMSDELGGVRMNASFFSFLDESMPDDSTHKILPSSHVQSLLTRRDTLWAGTTRGIRRFVGEAPLNSIILPNKPVRTLAPNKEFKLWAGVFGSEQSVGAGVYLLKSDGSPVLYLSEDRDGGRLLGNSINQIIQQGSRAWVATNAGLSSFILTPSLRDSAWKNYTVDSIPAGLVSNQINSIAFDRRGRLWCGTPAGISVLDTVANEWEDAITRANGLFGDDCVTNIAMNPTNGEMWLGTCSAGISIYDGSTWSHLDRSTVLADNAINDIVFSKDGEVWVATPSGVNRRDVQGIWCTLNVQSGLSSAYVQAVALQGDSIRWFGARDGGLIRYRPPRSLPQTFIETRLDVTDKSEVTYRFSAADLNTSLSEFRYRYWLDDDPPSLPTSDRFAVVAVDSTGRHTFHVQAIDRDGNLDPDEARDFFTRINPDSGGSSMTIDSTSFPKIGRITVKVYWPPYELSKDTEISITAAGLTPADSTTLFAFDIKSENAGKDSFLRPATLTFAFPKRDSLMGTSLAIYRDSLQPQRLGGTPGFAENMNSLSTSIQALGRYSVRIDTLSADSRPPQDVTAPVTAQPRIFSPGGGGHGPETTLSFHLPQSGHVKIQVYNLAGRLVDTIWDERMNSGINAVAWDGKDKHGDTCPTGLYILIVDGEGFRPPPKPVKVMVLNE